MSVPKHVAARDRQDDANRKSFSLRGYLDYDARSRVRAECCPAHRTGRQNNGGNRAIAKHNQ